MMIHLIVGLIFSIDSSVNAYCSTPQLTEGGYFLTCGNIPGAVCQARCRNSDVILVKRCQDNGSWVGDSFDCDGTNESCKKTLKAPANGSIVGECNNQLWSVCNFKCNPNFKLVGSAQVYCLGTWSSSEPTCVKIAETNTSVVSCPALQTPKNGYLEGSCYQGARVGTLCYFGCSPGHILSGSTSSICLNNGQWSSPVPLCVANPPTSAKPPTESSKTTPSPTKTTPGGKKPPTPPTTGKCEPIKEVENGKLRGNCQSGTPGSTCILTCSYGHYLSGGPNTVTCQNSSKWSGNLGSCNRAKYLIIQTWYW